MRSLWPCAGVLFVTRRHRRFSSAVGRNKRSALRRPSQNTLAARKTGRGQRHRPPGALAPAAQCASLIAPYGLRRFYAALRGAEPRGEAPFTLSVARREPPRGKPGREEAWSNHMRSPRPCARVLFVTRRHRRVSSAVGRNKRSALRRHLKTRSRQG